MAAAAVATSVDPAVARVVLAAVALREAAGVAGALAPVASAAIMAPLASTSSPHASTR